LFYPSPKTNIEKKVKEKAVSREDPFFLSHPRKDKKREGEKSKEGGKQKNS